MFKEITRNEEFLKLANIGGHKVYHLEGDALIHTMDVVAEASIEFDKDPLFVKIALLHDVGKIYTAIRHGDDDWEYPDHAMCGSFRGVLSKFIPETDPDFKTVQWFIRNHIKPLFWKGKGVDVSILNNVPSDVCTIHNLARLAICDIKGSKSVEPQDDLINYLRSL